MGNRPASASAADDSKPAGKPCGPEGVHTQLARKRREKEDFTSGLFSDALWQEYLTSPAGRKHVAAGIVRARPDHASAADTATPAAVAAEIDPDGRRVLQVGDVVLAMRRPRGRRAKSPWFAAEVVDTVGKSAAVRYMQDGDRRTGMSAQQLRYVAGSAGGGLPGTARGALMQVGRGKLKFFDASKVARALQMSVYPVHVEGRTRYYRPKYTPKRSTPADPNPLDVEWSAARPQFRTVWGQRVEVIPRQEQDKLQQKLHTV